MHNHLIQASVRIQGGSIHFNNAALPVQAILHLSNPLLLPMPIRIQTQRKKEVVYVYVGPKTSAPGVQYTA